MQTTIKNILELSSPDKSVSMELSISIQKVNALWAISHLTKTPVTSPNDHIPVKPSPSVYTTAEEDDSKSEIGQIEDYECDQLGGCGEDKLYNPEYMEIDGTYDHITQIPLTFTCGALMEITCNHHDYNGTSLAVRENALNRFKDSLEACVVCCGWWSLLWIDISFDLTFEIMKKLLDTNGVTNVAEIYHFLVFLLKISLISSDINGFWSLCYPPMYAELFPTCKFEITNYPSWTKLYISYSMV